MTDFAHRLPIDQIRDGSRMDLVADDAERAAIAARLGLVSLDRFDAHVTLHRDGRTLACSLHKRSGKACGGLIRRPKSRPRAPTGHYGTRCIAGH